VLEDSLQKLSNPAKQHDAERRYYRNKLGELSVGDFSRDKRAEFICQEIEVLLTHPRNQRVIYTNNNFKG
jgi:hypothetical protein